MTLNETLQATTKELLQGKSAYLHRPGSDVLLVAHVDTVHQRLPSKIYHDSIEQVLWSPDGLGADDRAGVYATSILAERYGCGQLLCDGEERGGIGAHQVPTDIVKAYKVLIELDRRGSEDAVYYSCGSSSLREWTQSFGWTEAVGSFSDISILGPAADRAAVNLSIGYYDEHTSGEYLCLSELEASIARVVSMLQSPPLSILTHEADKTCETRTLGKWDWDDPDGRWDSLSDPTWKPTTLPALRPCPLCRGLGSHVAGDLYLCDDCGHTWSDKGQRQSRRERKRVRRLAQQRGLNLQ